MGDAVSIAPVMVIMQLSKVASCTRRTAGGYIKESALETVLFSGSCATMVICASRGEFTQDEIEITIIWPSTLKARRWQIHVAVENRLLSPRPGPEQHGPTTNGAQKRPATEPFKIDHKGLTHVPNLQEQQTIPITTSPGQLVNKLIHAPLFFTLSPYYSVSKFPAIIGRPMLLSRGSTPSFISNLLQKPELPARCLHKADRQIDSGSFNRRRLAPRFASPLFPNPQPLSVPVLAGVVLIFSSSSSSVPIYQSFSERALIGGMSNRAPSCPRASSPGHSLPDNPPNFRLFMPAGLISAEPRTGQEVVLCGRDPTPWHDPSARSGRRGRYYAWSD